ncbi:MAG: F0F1 ATP synthase subunit B family protein [Candidatus Aminicenantales bacterium]
MNAKRALAVLLLVPFLVFATVNEEAVEHQESGGSGFLPKIVNFVILFGALFYFLRKPLGAMLTRKSNLVRDFLTEARSEREKADARLAEARVQVATLKNEAARLKAQAFTEGKDETVRITESAVKEAARIRTLAAQEVAVRLKAGIRELKEYTAGLAADIAEAKMKARLTEADQVALIDRSIDRLKTIHEERVAR